MASYLSGSSWLTVNGGCEISCHTSGSDAAHLVIGESPQVYELDFDFEMLSQLVAQTTAVLAEMDAKAREEQAEEEE